MHAINRICPSSTQHTPHMRVRCVWQLAGVWMHDLSMTWRSVGYVVHAVHACAAGAVATMRSATGKGEGKKRGKGTFFDFRRRPPELAAASTASLRASRERPKSTADGRTAEGGNGA